MNHSGYNHLDGSARDLRFVIELNMISAVPLQFILWLSHLTPVSWHNVLYIVLVITMVANAVTLLSAAYRFLTWMHKARVNAKQLTGLALTPSVALGGWFMPVVNLYLPYVVMNELWRRSLTDCVMLPKRESTILSIWWVSWAMAWIVPLAGVGFLPGQVDSVAYKILVPTLTGASIITAALMINKIITLITNEQNRAYAMQLEEASEKQQAQIRDTASTIEFSQHIINIETAPSPVPVESDLES